MKFASTSLGLRLLVLHRNRMQSELLGSFLVCIVRKRIIEAGHMDSGYQILRSLLLWYECFFINDIVDLLASWVHEIDLSNQSINHDLNPWPQ